MAIIRQGNWLSQMRVDVPDLRALESSITADFDMLAGHIWAGRVPLIVRGFTISTTNMLGARADTLQLSTASGVLVHHGATEAGSVYVVPDTQPAELLSAVNTRVSGSFTANTTNYVGLDLIRKADTSTSDSTKFLDANTKKEITKTVPKARVLEYRIVISNQPFSASTTICPIAKVVTDSLNNVVSVEDARNMMFRLGTGGDIPNPNAGFTWIDSGRRENSNIFSATYSTNPFAGGDKEIYSFKKWMDALMSRLWELGSGRFWYSPNSRDNVKFLYGQPTLASNNDNFAFGVSGPNRIEWSGITVAFENSFTDSGTGVYSNTVANSPVGGVDILDGQCLYVDIQRNTVGATVTPQVVNLTQLGTPTVPGSRFIMAWRIGSYVYARDRGFEVGRTTPVATTTTLGIVRLSHVASNPASPVVLTDTARDAVNGVVGLSANKTASVVAQGTNQTAIYGEGTGNGIGVRGVGGPSGTGVYGSATNFGIGVSGQGGSTGGAGVRGVAVGGNDVGVDGVGNGTGAGVKGMGGNTTDLFSDGGAGVEGTGGTGGGEGAPGPGVRGTGGTGDGNGVEGNGTGQGTGVKGVGGPGNGDGVLGMGGGTNGAGGRFVGSGTGAAVVAVGNVEMKGSNPASNAPYNNTITPANVVKAWSTFKINNNITTILNGFNIQSISNVTDVGGGIPMFVVTVTIPFGGGFSNINNYCVVVTAGVGHDYSIYGMPTIEKIDGRTFRIHGVYTDTGQVTYDFMVMGTH